MCLEQMRTPGAGGQAVKEISGISQLPLSSFVLARAVGFLVANGSQLSHEDIYPAPCCLIFFSAAQASRGFQGLPGASRALTWSAQSHTLEPTRMPLFLSHPAAVPSVNPVGSTFRTSPRSSGCPLLPPPWGTSTISCLGYCCGLPASLFAFESTHRVAGSSLKGHLIYREISTAFDFQRENLESVARKVQVRGSVWVAPASCPWVSMFTGTGLICTTAVPGTPHLCKPSTTP